MQKNIKNKQAEIDSYINQANYALQAYNDLLWKGKRGDKSKSVLSQQEIKSKLNKFRDNLQDYDKMIKSANRKQEKLKNEIASL